MILSVGVYTKGDGVGIQTKGVGAGIYTEGDGVYSMGASHDAGATRSEYIDIDQTEGCAYS